MGTKRKVPVMKNHYDAEFKREALQLWRSSGRSAAKVAAQLGIRAPLLYRWARAEREPNEVDQSKPTSTPKSVVDLEAEISRLKTENTKLLEQREVLKKSLGILCEPPPRGMPKSPA